MPTLLQKHRCKRKPTWITVNWDESTSIDTKLNYITRSQRPWLPPYRTSHPKHQPIIRTYSNNVFSRIENTSTILNTSSTYVKVPRCISLSLPSPSPCPPMHLPVYLSVRVSAIICIDANTRPLHDLCSCPGFWRSTGAHCPARWGKQKHTKT